MYVGEGTSSSPSMFSGQLDTAAAAGENLAGFSGPTSLYNSLGLQQPRPHGPTRWLLVLYFYIGLNTPAGQTAGAYVGLNPSLLVGDWKQLGDALSAGADVAQVCEGLCGGGDEVPGGRRRLDGDEGDPEGDGEGKYSGYRTTLI